MAKKKAQDGAKFFEEVAKLPKKKESMPANLKRDFTREHRDKLLKNPLIKKKSIVFAEAPTNELPKYDLFSTPKKDLPKELAEISKENDILYKLAEEINVKRQKKGLSTEEMNQYLDMHSKVLDKITELGEKFYDPNINPIIKKTADEFIKEAGNLKSFYKRTDPNREVEILPVYGKDSQKLIQEKIQSVGFADDIFIFGHSGNRYAGLDNEWWNKQLKQSSYNKCFLGSCGTENIKQKYFADLPDFSYRPYGPWLGVNPNAATLEDAMFSRIRDKNNQPVIGRPEETFDKHTINKREMGGKTKRKAQAGAQLPKIPTPTIPLKDYGVKRTDPQAHLEAEVNSHLYSRKNPMDWSKIAGGLLAASSLIPGETIHNPVVRPQLGYNPNQYGTGSQAIAENGITISDMGYKRNSKDKNKKKLRIPSNQITMEGVDFPVLGQSNTGHTQIMLPGNNYMFDGSYVDEIPLKAQLGAKIPKGAAQLRQLGQVADPLYPGSQVEGDIINPEKLRARNDYMGSTKSISDFYYLNPLTSPGTTSPKDSFPMRKWRAENLFGIPNYKGTAKQNALLLELEQKDWNSTEDPQQMQMGGQVVGTPQERAQANALAQRLALKNGLMDPSNMQIGEFLPQFLDSQGNPVQGTASPQLPTRLPSHVKLEDVQQANGQFWYTDPQTGYVVDVDPTVFRDKRFQKPKDQVAYDLAGRTVEKGVQNMKVAFKNGGRLKKFSYNNGGSLTPLSGDTLQLNGPSHANGGIPFMGIEAEGGETAFKSKDGSINIMGNMINPLTGRKFKQDSKVLAKKDKKMEELMDYSMDLINEGDIKDKWGILKFNSGKVQFEGAAKKKQELEQSKEYLSTIQQSMLQVAEENDLDPGAFSRGILKKAKRDNTAQNGKKLSMAQRNNNPGNLKFAKWMEKYGAVPSDAGTDGGNFAKFPSIEQGQKAMVALLKDKNYQSRTVEDAIKRWTNNQPYKNIPETLKGKKVSSLNPEEFTTLLNTITKGEDSKTYNWTGVPVPDVPSTVQKEIDIDGALNTPLTNFTPKMPTINPRTGAPVVGKATYDLDISGPNQYQKPSDAEPLPFSQVLPELYTAATNQVDPVFMQEFNPQLFQDYEVSFQDRLNENQGTFNALTRSVQNDPSALATLAAQKYQADQQVLGEEFRTNQAIQQDVTNKNIALLNDAQLKNLQLADNQYVRQSTAKSKTKQQNQVVLQSISDKIHQNLLEQRTLKVYENLYPNYSFGDDYVTDFTGPAAGEAINWKPSFQPLESNAQITVRTDNKGNVSTTKKYPSTVQQQLQNLQLTTNKLKYKDYFLGMERKIAKDSRK